MCTYYIGHAPCNNCVINVLPIGCKGGQGVVYEKTWGLVSSYIPKPLPDIKRGGVSLATQPKMEEGSRLHITISTEIYCQTLNCFGCKGGQGVVYEERWGLEWWSTPYTPVTTTTSTRCHLSYGPFTPPVGHRR